MDLLVKHRNSINLWFKEKGENWTLDVPHRNIWDSIIPFLRKRGFTVSANPHYVERYKNTLSKYHKFAQKNDVICLLEIGCWFIKLHFGHRKNLWEGNTTSFWDDPNDNRHKPQTYLETLVVNLEVTKMLGFLARYEFETKDQGKKLSPEEYIIDRLKNNTHIHGVVTCLEDIKKSITEESYNFKQNSDDKNGKKIICGETKYYYDYMNKRLSRGIAWHNINNMWWVISNQSLRNIAAHELFDFEQGLPRRKPMPLKGERLNNLIDSFVQKRDFRKCAALQTYGEKYGLFAA